MTNPNPVVLEEDLYMERPENYIPAEEVTLNSTTGKIFGLQYGCFFSENLVVRKVGQAQPLVPNLGFTALHLQKKAAASAGREVLTIIRIDLPDWEGDYTVDYHAVGGAYSTNPQVIEDLIANEGGDLENVPWGTIVGAPDQYNPADHTHVVSVDIKMWNDMVYALDRMTDAIYNGGIPTVDALFSYMNVRMAAEETARNIAIDTHNTAASAHNKSAVGLGQLLNLPNSTKTRLNAGTQSYVTTDVLPMIVGKAFSNGIRTMSAGQVTEPVAVITDTIAELHASPRNYIIIQGGVDDNKVVTETTTPRWQVAICVTQTEMGRMAVRIRSESAWGSWSRMDVGKLSNVPNYPAAQVGTAGDVSATTTVTEKLATPAVSAEIARNVVAANDGPYWTVSNNQEGDEPTITFPASMTGKKAVIHFTGYAWTSRATATVSGGVTVEARNTANAQVGQFVFDDNAFIGADGARVPMSGHFVITVPASGSRTIRFGFDYDSGTARGMMGHVIATRLA